MKKIISGLLIAIFIPLVNTFASIEKTNEYRDKLKESLMELNILPLSEYPNLINKFKVSGDKQSFDEFDGVSVSKRMIYQLLKRGVDSGNLDKSYLSNGIDWEIHEVFDMQPGWEDNKYEKWYYPKYFAMSPKKYNKEEIINSMLDDLQNSASSLKNIYLNFDKIFNKNTPVYLNDAMFYVDMDKQGFYLVNLLGLNRFALPLSTSKTGSAIHLGKLKMDVTTLIHEYLHDKISSSGDRFNSLNHLPLLGFKNNIKDITLSARKIRGLIDNHAKNNNVRGTWWSPMANTELGPSSYNFTMRNNANDSNLTEIEKEDVMYFMEELMVRIVSESLFSDSGNVEEILSDVDGLNEYFEEIGANKTLGEFANNLYGLDNKISIVSNNTTATSVLSKDFTINSENFKVKNGFVYLDNGFKFTLEEYEEIKDVLIESLNINKLALSNIKKKTSQ